MPHDDTQTTAWNARVDIEKRDDDQRLVFGWLYKCRTPDGAQVIDHSGEIVDVEVLEAASYEFVLDYRVGGVMHEKVDASGHVVKTFKPAKQVARLVECVVFTPEKRKAMGVPEGVLPDAMWVGFKVDDDDVWKRVKSGELRMLSFGGTALKHALEG